MPRYGKTSRARLETCHPDLQRVFNKVIEGWDCSILCGYRGEEEQNKAFDEGRSKVRFPDGKHNNYPSDAVDVAPFPIDWNDTARFAYFAGYVMRVAEEEGVKLRWGGDFNMNRRVRDGKFIDMPHFELVR